jgi:catecholate siderophore receptor
MRLLVLASLFALAAHPPTAATAAADVRGTVYDPMRAPIAGARLVLTSAEGTPAESTLTDERGTFSIAAAPGHYVLTVIAPGFREGTAAVRLTTTATVDVTLAIAGIEEAVTVTAPSPYQSAFTRTATKTATPLLNVPQSVTVVTRALMQDQMMVSVGDVMRYVPGITVHQGENNRDQVIIRGNSSSADFFVDGVRDDVQYYRDLYNLDRVEALKGPNAMIFGRGGAGGVVNRVSKAAGPRASRELTVQGGSYGHKRVTAGMNQPLNNKVALRLDAMFEDSDSYRDFVGLTRRGFTPTVTIAPSDRTTVTLRYEFLTDRRIADRGITSSQNRPVDVPLSTFYGNPDLSRVEADVHMTSATVEHRRGNFTIRNHTHVANYDRFYRNFVPGTVSPAGTQVALSAYDNRTGRLNVFNQTDLTRLLQTGRVRHTLLAGAEFGRQETDNFRQTGFFGGTAASILVPYSNPTITTPVTFRQNATDADNHLVATVAAAYVQDQIDLAERVQVVGGVRVDQFRLRYHNNRNGDTLTRPDTLVSPRTGLVFKPAAAVSIYGNFSVSYLPSSGDQFSSLTIITEQVKPEYLRNYEVGVKWGAPSGLSITTAAYRLDRTNTRSTDPSDPTRIVQTGSQRTNGYELGLNGRVATRWTVAGGYAYQHAFVTSATTAATAGAQVAQVPHHTLSLWNNYQLHPRLGAGLGVLHRTQMFAAIDNTVVLPGYTRADAALFVTLTPQLRLQANVENIGNTRYYVNADGNTNITPGCPRALRVGLTARF